MTVDQARRRCTGCGRFLSAEALEDGACTSCGTAVRRPAATSNDAAAGAEGNGTRATTTDGSSANGAGGPSTDEPEADSVPADAVAVPIEAPGGAPAPIGVPPTRASASLSTQAIRAPRGVVIMRPSELHPDAPSPVVRPAPERLPEVRPDPKPLPAPAPPTPERRVEPARASRPEAAPPPVVVPPVAAPPVAPPTVVAPMSQARPARVSPAPEPVRSSSSDGGGMSILWWTVRIVVGVSIGILIGVAIPLLLSR